MNNDKIIYSLIFLLIALGICFFNDSQKKKIKQEQLKKRNHWNYLGYAILAAIILGIGFSRLDTDVYHLWFFVTACLCATILTVIIVQRKNFRPLFKSSYLNDKLEKKPENRPSEKKSPWNCSWQVITVSIGLIIAIYIFRDNIHYLWYFLAAYCCLVIIWLIYCQRKSRKMKQR